MPLADDLEQYYTCEESANQTLVDVHGSLDLTDVSGAGTTTGKIDNGRDLERGDVDKFHTSSAIANSLPLSIYAWIKLESADTDRTIVSGGITATEHISTWGLQVDDGNHLEFFCANAGGSFLFVTGGTALSTGVWYFVTLIWRSATDYQIYLNGASEGTGSTSRTPSAGQDRFYIGAYAGQGNGGNHFDGVIDEVAIFSRDITSDLSQFYNGGDGISYDDIINPPAGFSASPSPIQRHFVGKVLTLTGTGTAWDGTTVFTASGVTGASITAINVTSATTATVTVTTGTGTGTMTITESVTGSATADVTVQNTWSSKANGNWTTQGQTTWNEDGYPVSGDLVTIASHTVTADDNLTVGTSPATAAAYGSARNFTTHPAAIRITGSGALTIAAGKTLTVLGDIDTPTATGKTITMGAGSQIVLDPSAAPADTRYNLSNIFLTANGSSGSRCVIDFGSGRFIGEANCSTIISDFLTIQNAGLDSDTYGIQLRPNTQHLRLVDCRIEDSAPPTIGTVSADTANFIVQRLTVTGSLTGLAWDVLAIAAPSTGERVWEDVVLDGGITALANTSGIDMGRTVLLGFMNIAPGTCNLTSVSNWFLWPDDEGNDYTIPTADFSDSFFFYNDHGHMLSVEPAIDSDIEFSGLIFEHDGNDANLRIGILAQSHDNRTLTVSRCIAIPNAGQNPSCVLVASTALTDEDTTFEVDHCTALGGATGGLVVIDDIYPGHAGMIAGVTNSLCWAESGDGGFKVADTGDDDAIEDLVLSANLHHNAGSNLDAGSNLNGYDELEFSSGSPGANDLNADPELVNGYIGLATWDLSLGGPGTGAHAMAEMAKLNDSDFNSSYTIENLLTYIRNGNRPTNEAYDAAASDGETIGAVEFVASGGIRRRRILCGA